MTTENSTGLSGLRVTRIINTARVILDDEALVMIAEALEQYAETLDSRDDTNPDDCMTLAMLVRNTTENGGALDMPMWDDERDERDARTMALLADLRERGAVTA